MAGSTNFCLICNASCVSIRNSFQIFTTNGSPTELNLPQALCELLNKEISEPTIHSKVVCKKCYKLINEFEEMQNRVTEIKTEISENYHNTVKAQECAENVVIISSEDPLLHSGKIAESSGELPKKILDIPSSDDDESSQAIEDMEMALVRIHSSQDNVLESENSLFITPLEDVKVPEIKRPMKQASILTTSDKPNLLKRKPQPGVRYTDNIIIQEPVDKLKKMFEENPNTPIVSRNDNIYTCLLCTGEETVSGEPKAIIAHVKEVHDTRLYICDICGLDFRKRNLLSAHVDEHVANEDGDFQCEVCNRIFNNLRLFRIHRRIHQPNAKAWECCTCNKKYSSKNLLNEHINTHLGVRPYVCPTCGKDFASKYTFKSHEKTHLSRPRPFTCDKCDKAFLSQQHLVQHEKTHLAVKDYQCVLCNKRFATVHNLEVHSVVHTGYKPYICGLCGKAFARKAEIRDHERTHTGERPFQCEFCGATFSQRSNLQSHKRVTHYDDKRYKCEDCGKCFKRRRLLDYHIKAAHTGERPYKCEICEATFVYPEHFKKHRRIHTGEKPFICEICGKAFNSRDNRNAHRFIHSDKKPYECLLCGAGFMRKPFLYQHMQSSGHLNDTIVINQPKLTLDEKVTMDAEGHLVTIEEEPDSKIFIEGEDEEDSIIIDDGKLTFADSSDNEEPEIVDEIEQVMATEDGEYEEILSTEPIAASDTQIIETEEGPVQLVKVKITENGREEEAWIKIVPAE
ncbi:zinc finger protein ZFP2-like [Euwallacea fornicatus]|uniref:zinc finger protein ZFP2-like n=1 Tax=Euwallacea fornicatus TaxID=995702 RepID=UPI00338FF18C